MTNPSNCDQPRLAPKLAPGRATAVDAPAAPASRGVQPAARRLEDPLRSLADSGPRPRRCPVPPRPVPRSLVTPSSERAVLGGSWPVLLDARPLARSRGFPARVAAMGARRCRRAAGARACARIPLLRPVDLRARVTARAPSKRLLPIMKVTLNGLPRAGGPGPGVDRECRPLPASAMVPGENLLCLEFDDTLPGPDGQRVAARVRTIVVH